MSCSIAPDIRRKFSKEEINALPLYHYSGNVSLIRDDDAMSHALERMRRDWLLGFDTESRPSFRKGIPNKPSLIQIACSDIVFLIQISRVALSHDFLALLEDPSIFKAGVAVHDDMRLLTTLVPFRADGVVDLGGVARDNGLATQGLRTLAANFLHVRISKGAQCSNWGQKELSSQQIAYAATDAWISRQVYLAMDRLGFFAPGRRVFPFVAESA